MLRAQGKVRYLTTILTYIEDWESPDRRGPPEVKGPVHVLTCPRGIGTFVEGVDNDVGRVMTSEQKDFFQVLRQNQGLYWAEMCHRGLSCLA